MLARICSVCSLVMLTTAEPALAQWQVSRVRDELTDELRVLITRKADRVVSTRSGSQRLPTITLRCDGANLEVIVSYGTVLESNADGWVPGWVPVRWRVDSKEIQEEGWRASKSRTAVFAPEPNTVADAMLKAALLRVEAPEWPSSDALLGRFSVGGLAPLLKRLDCWYP